MAAGGGPEEALMLLDIFVETFLETTGGCARCGDPVHAINVLLNDAEAVHFRLFEFVF